ncbi:hypothetical protein CJ030_MR5G001029 [Morella rubra]|uniref:Uncharacterized protein n=1 Tax=Morella rubra TaxID=262757 RepID=A0A6A1VIT7_9ROSI|nr:hypothetical protein CJ030_MR5G001029 [Morella rubra]
MESKFLLRDEAKQVVHREAKQVVHRDSRGSGKKETSASESSSCSCSCGDSKCCHKTTECLCSACLLCVCCPLSVVWVCVRLPCKLGWRAAKHAKRWVCCGSEMRDFAAYSSFSDDDSDNLSRSSHSRSKPLAGPKKRMVQPANESDFSKSAGGRNSK